MIFRVIGHIGFVALTIVGGAVVTIIVAIHGTILIAPFVERYHRFFPEPFVDWLNMHGFIGFGEEVLYSDPKPYLDSLHQPDEDDLDYASVDSANSEIPGGDE